MYLRRSECAPLCSLCMCTCFPQWLTIHLLHRGVGPYCTSGSSFFCVCFPTNCPCVRPSASSCRFGLPCRRKKIKEGGGGLDCFISFKENKSQFITYDTRNQQPEASLLWAFVPRFEVFFFLIICVKKKKTVSDRVQGQGSGRDRCGQLEGREVLGGPGFRHRAHGLPGRGHRWLRPLLPGACVFCVSSVCAFTAAVF